MRLRFFLATLTLCALIVSACTGGDGDPASPSPSPTVTAPAPAPMSAEEFATVLARFGSADQRITYTFTTETSGQEFSGVLTWIRAADGRERVETSSEQGDEAILVVVIKDATGGQVSCFNVGGFESCFRGDDGPFAELPNPTEIIFQNVLDPDRVTEVEATRSREILGLTTTCYEVTASEGTSEACFAEGDRLLSATWTAPSGDGGSLEATEFSTSVTDDDFEPTVPIAD